MRVSVLVLMWASMSALSQAQLPDIVLDSETTTGIAPHSITISGSWTDGASATDKHGLSNKHANNTYGANKWVQYTPSIPSAGWYRVYLWNVATTNYANNVELDLNTADGLLRPDVNQRQDGGLWNLIGTYRFNAGTSGYLKIKTTRQDGVALNGNVAADAVRFIKVEPDIVIDSHDATGAALTGAWSTVADPFTTTWTSARPAVNSNYHHDGNTGQNEVATRSIEFKPNIPVAGKYQVYVTWVADPTNSPNAHIDVYNAGPKPVDTAYVDQRDPGYEWVYVGEYQFEAGSNANGRVVISNRYDSVNGETGGRVVIDAVRFVRVPAWEQVIDQADPEATSAGTSGTWSVSGLGTKTPSRFGRNHANDGNPGTKGNHTYRFTPNIPTAGFYSIYMWWPEGITSTKTPIDVISGGITQSPAPPLQNQSINGGKWNYLGKWWFNVSANNSLLIRNNGADGSVNADGIAFVRGEDGDEDGMADSWELANGFNPSSAADANTDADGDGLSNVEEYRAGLDPHTAQTLSYFSGNNQTAPANATLASPLQVKVTTGQTPAVGAPVTFTATAGNGSISDTASQGAGSSSVTCFTDANGVATAYWTLGKFGSTNYTVTAKLGQSSPVSFTARSNDMVAWWKLNEGTGTTATDSSGTGHHALISSPDTDPWGQSFDGTSSLVFKGRVAGPQATSISNINANYELIPDTPKPFSFSFWFKTEQLTAGRLYWLTTCESYNQRGFRMGIDTGLYQSNDQTPRVQFWTTESGGSIFLRADEKIEPGKWYHAAVTYDGNTAILYLNRKQAAAASGNIVAGTNGIQVGTYLGGSYEFSGQIDDLKIYSAVVPPSAEQETTVVAPQYVVLKEDQRALVNLGPAWLTYEIVQQPANGKLRGDGASWIYNPNPDFSGSDSFTYRIASGPAQGTVVTATLGVIPLDDPAEPVYQETIVVDKGMSVAINLKVRNPDGHNISLSSPAITGGDLYSRGLPGTLTGGGANWTYTAPNETGEAILKYAVTDTQSGGAPKEQKVFIHVVRSVYLASRPNEPAVAVGDEAQPSSASQPLNVKDAESYTRVITHPDNSRYTRFYYEAGVYETSGWKYQTRRTSNIGCKHWGAGSANTTIRLVEASDKNAEGYIFAQDYNVGWDVSTEFADGFEVRNLTLDCNAMGNPKWQDDPGAFGGVSCMGSNIILSGVRVIGFGTSAIGSECFPVLLYSQVKSPPFIRDFENIIVDQCIFESPATENMDGCSQLLIFVPREQGTLKNGVIRNCYFNLDSDFTYVHGGSAPLVENCYYFGGGRNTTTAFYFETGNLVSGNPNSTGSEHYFRGNTLDSVWRGVDVNMFHDTSIGKIRLEDNEFLGAPAAPSDHTQPHPIATFFYFPGLNAYYAAQAGQVVPFRTATDSYPELKATFLERVEAVGNVVRAKQSGYRNYIYGFYLPVTSSYRDVVYPFSGSNVYKPTHVEAVAAADNVLSVAPDKDFTIVEPLPTYVPGGEPSLFLPFEALYNNVSDRGEAIILRDTGHQDSTGRDVASRIQQPLSQ